MNRKTLLIILCAAAAVLLIVLGIALWGTFSMKMDVSFEGEKEIVLEAGSTYEEPGVFATATGGFLGDAVKIVSVKTSGSVNTTKVGTYKLTYTASYAHMKVQKHRTVKVQDTTAPVITLKEIEGSFTLVGQKYQEEGFVAMDACDGDITDKVVRTETENEVTYTVTDAAGNSTTVKRPIVYGDKTAPVITLKGDSTITITVGSKFTEPGFTATDNLDGDVTDKVIVSNDPKEYSIYRTGEQTITYKVTDSYGNTATVTRKLIVKPNPNYGEGKTIYLTFDDGPCSHTSRLLDVLKKYNVPATFFVLNNGKNVNKVMQRMVDEGHAIGVHSNTHDYDVIYASSEAFWDDFNKVRQVIYDNTGVWTNLMRFPGGTSNTVSRKYCKGIMTQLSKEATEKGYVYFDWNVSSGDAGGGSTTKDQVVEEVIRGVKSRQNSIVLQHDIKGFSVDAVEEIIIWGLENGFTFKSLDENSYKVQFKPNN